MANPRDAWLQHPTIGIPPEVFRLNGSETRKERHVTNQLRVPFNKTVAVGKVPKTFEYFEATFVISVEVTGKAEVGGGKEEEEGEANGWSTNREWPRNIRSGERR